jgi:Fe-S oxidoreductase
MKVKNHQFNSFHYTQILIDLLRKGVLRFENQIDARVTYHDPCYLGRHNNVYDEPRDVLKKIPGLEFLEMADSRKNSLCCGGGGGRIWMDTPKEERFSDLRLVQASEAGAQVLATSCPYCITNFEESRLNLEYEDILEVKDITEIIQEVI